MNATAPRRRWLWYGFGGLTFTVFLAAVCLIGSYSVWKSRQQAQQRQAIAAVEALGGEAQHAFSSLSLMARVLESGDAPNLIFLDSKNIGDGDLSLFESAPATRALYLFGNKITDQGLVHISGLTELEVLDLRRNNITDTGLAHLENLHSLKELNLIGTQVTPAGVKKLQQKLPDTKIAY